MKEVPVADRRFNLHGKGVWPYKTLVQFASKVTSGKGNEKSIDDLDVGGTVNAVISDETIKVTRTI